MITSCGGSLVNDDCGVCGGTNSCYGCTDSTAQNYDENATIDDGNCTYNANEVYGCTNPDAINYNENATIDNGSWSLEGNQVYGEYQLTTGDNLDNFSISMRVIIANESEKHDSIVSSSQKNNKLGSWQIGMTGSTAIKFSSQQLNGSVSSEDLLLSKNSWHHIVLTKSNSNEIKIYTNNRLSETLQLNDWSIEWLRVGTNRNTTNFWKGNIDDIRIYDYVLNADNINDLYQIYN